MTMTATKKKLVWHEGSEAVGATISVEWVDRDLASDFLTRNTRNRPMNVRNVERYAHAMETGNWLFDGSPLRFDGHDVMLDGQNRCQAVVISGCGQWFMVVRDLSAKTQDNMDINSRRSLAQQLYIDGVTDPTPKAAATEAWVRWEESGRTNFPISNASSSVLSLAEKKDVFYAQSWIEDEFGWIRKVFRHTALTSGPSAVLWRTFSTIDRADAEHFFTLLCTDAGHREGSPILALRRALGRFDFPGQGPDQRSMVAISIKAWNIYRAEGVDNSDCRVLSFRSGGSAPESFPIAK